MKQRLLLFLLFLSFFSLHAEEESFSFLTKNRTLHFLNRYQNSTNYRGVPPHFGEASFKTDLLLSPTKAPFLFKATPMAHAKMGTKEKETPFSLDQLYVTASLPYSFQVELGRKDQTWGEGRLISGFEDQWEKSHSHDMISLAFKGDVYQGDLAYIAEKDERVAYRDWPSRFAVLFYNQFKTSFLQEFDLYFLYRQNGELIAEEKTLRDNVAHRIYLGGRLLHRWEHFHLGGEYIFSSFYPFNVPGSRRAHLLTAEGSVNFGAFTTLLRYFEASERFTNDWASLEMVGSLMPLFDLTNITSYQLQETVSYSDRLSFLLRASRFHRTLLRQTMFHPDGTSFRERGATSGKYYIGSEYAMIQELSFLEKKELILSLKEAIFMAGKNMASFDKRNQYFCGMEFKYVF